MKTTISRVRALNPCVLGYQNLLGQLGGGFDKYKEFELSGLVGGKNTMRDITWLLGETNNGRALVELAVFSAELVLPIHEKINDGNSLRKTIELVKKRLNNKSSVTKQELRAAASAIANANTVCTTASAASAVYAVHSVARSAVAENTAIIAARSAASAVHAFDAACAAIKKQINDKFIEIIDSIKD